MNSASKQKLASVLVGQGATEQQAKQIVKLLPFKGDRTDFTFAVSDIMGNDWSPEQEAVVIKLRNAVLNFKA